jgi:hypothetical protein
MNNLKNVKYKKWYHDFFMMHNFVKNVFFNQLRFYTSSQKMTFFTFLIIKYLWII